MRSFLYLGSNLNYLDFFAHDLAADFVATFALAFAEVFFGAAILLAEVLLLLLFFAEEVLFNIEDAVFNREEDLLAEDNCLIAKFQSCRLVPDGQPLFCQM